MSIKIHVSSSILLSCHKALFTCNDKDRIKVAVHDLEHILTPSKCSSPLKECSHVTKFSPSPKFRPILFCTGIFVQMGPQPIQPIKWTKQECIPVGCVPSAAVAVCWGVSGRGRVSAQRGCVPACTEADTIPPPCGQNS